LNFVGEETLDFLFEEANDLSANKLQYTAQDNSSIIVDISHIVSEFKRGMLVGQYVFKFEL
jgi:hypothetical protein